MTTLTALALVIFTLSGAGVQTRPDLTGTWALGLPDNNAEPGETTGRGNRPDGSLRVGPAPFSLVISHTGERLRIVERRTMPTLREATRELGLNGQVVKSQFVAESVVPVQSTSTWQGNSLVSVIEIAGDDPANARRYIETMSIRADGVLVVRIQRADSSDSRTLFYQRGQ